MIGLAQVCQLLSTVGRKRVLPDAYRRALECLKEQVQCELKLAEADTTTPEGRLLRDLLIAKHQSIEEQLEPLWQEAAKIRLIVDEADDPQAALAQLSPERLGQLVGGN